MRWMTSFERMSSMLNVAIHHCFQFSVLTLHSFFQFPLLGFLVATSPRKPSSEILLHLTRLSFLLVSLPVFSVTTSPLNRPVTKSSTSWWTHGRLGGSGGYLIVSKVHVTTVFCICLITFGEALGQLNKSMKCHLKFCVRKCCVSKGIEFANNREWCTMEPMG